MPTPTDVILSHLQAVQAAFDAHNGSPAGAWRHLAATCPELAANMALNSFKVLAPAVLATVAHLHPPPPADTLPGNFMGWTTGRGADNLIRLHRRVDGKVRSLYIGRTWDEAKALARIKTFELKQLDGYRVTDV